MGCEYGCVCDCVATYVAICLGGPCVCMWCVWLCVVIGVCECVSCVSVSVCGYVCVTVVCEYSCVFGVSVCACVCVTWCLWYWRVEVGIDQSHRPGPAVGLGGPRRSPLVARPGPGLGKGRLLEHLREFTAGPLNNWQSLQNERFCSF